MNFVGLAITVIGLVALGYAGVLREREQAKKTAPKDDFGTSQTTSSPSRQNFMLGLVICIVSGFTSPCLNLSLAYGSPINERAIDLGVNKTFANNAVWCVGVGAGFFVNAIYAIYLLTKNRTWGLFRGQQPTIDNGLNDMLLIDNSGDGSLNGSGGKKQPAADSVAIWLIAGPVMGIFWFGGTALYGVGAQLLGTLGTSIGWSVYMICMILTGNVSGMLFGEWKGTSMTSRLWCGAGLALLCTAIAVIAGGGA